jgi:hypothetical protein
MTNFLFADPNELFAAPIIGATNNLICGANRICRHQKYSKCRCMLPIQFSMEQDAP